MGLCYHKRCNVGRVTINHVKFVLLVINSVTQCALSQILCEVRSKSSPHWSNVNIWLTSITFGIVPFKEVPVGAHIPNPAFLEQSLRDAVNFA
jgi:hypothetical protein